MRILILNYEFTPLGGGASPVSYELAKGYVKLGHKVTVITMGFKGLLPEEVVDGIKVYRVKCLRSKKEMCSPHEMLSYVLSAKRFLKRHMEEHTYDINHTHFIIPTGVVSLWLKKRYGLPYIVTSHGSDVLGYNKRFRFLYPLMVGRWRRIIKEAKVVVTPSKFLMEKIMEKAIGKFAVIPNGIDGTKFKPMKKEKRILIVARLFPNKGVQDILEALHGVDLSGWKVDIVGDGPYRAVLEEKAKGLSNVTFHGWVDHSSRKMKELYGHASIFISASYFESFGMTVLEAMSAGCYPIVSDIEAHREVVKRECLFKIHEYEELKNLLGKKLVKMSKNRVYLMDLNIKKTVLEYLRILK